MLIDVEQYFIKRGVWGFGLTLAERQKYRRRKN
jgi:hypothetical protein